MGVSTQTFRGVVNLETGDKIHEFDTTTSNAGSSVDVVSYTVTAGAELKLTKVTGTCSKAGVYELFEGLTKVDELRSSAAQKNVIFEYRPTKDVAAGVVVKLTFTQDSGSAATVSGMIQGAEL